MARRSQTTAPWEPNSKVRRSLFVATDGFEQVELTEPKKALEAEGAACDVVAPKGGKVKGFHHVDPGDDITVDVSLKDADASSYDALVLPGGVVNADALRVVPEAQAFVRRFIDEGKPVGVICHGGWILIETGSVDGRTMTSWPTLKTDLVNAGAEWVDKEVVTNGGLVSSRKPDDIPAFSRKLVEEIAEGRHAAR